MTYEPKTIGDRIRSGYSDVGYTMTGFADAVGVSRQTMSAWVNGHRRPDLDDAARICDVLDWPLDRLVRRDVAQAAD